MKKVQIIFACICFVLLGGSDALGCLCKPESPSHAIERLRKQAKVIFVGRVKTVTKEPKGYTTTFEIERSWKGDRAREITIYTEGGCMAWFEAGRSYVVYASLDSVSRLTTNVCMRTGLLKYATEDLKRLGKPQFTNDVAGTKTNHRVVR